MTSVCYEISSDIIYMSRDMSDMVTLLCYEIRWSDFVYLLEGPNVFDVSEGSGMRNICLYRNVQTSVE